MPPAHFCLYISKNIRDMAMRFSDVKDSEGCLSLPEMLTWWRGNRKYILWNQRTVVCPILNLPIKNNRHFQWLFSYFHGHLTWVCCWRGFLMSLFTGSAISLTNKIRKWTEMYMVWICASEMCDIHQEHVGFGIIRVLFVVVARVCRCVVVDRHTKIQDGA